MATITMPSTTEALPGIPPLDARGWRNDSTTTLDKTEIERLGRQRPAIFHHAWSEILYVFAIIASMLLSEYFISGFNIALPAIAVDLQIPDSQRTWPAQVINLTTAALLLPFARLCDQYGGRTVFLAGHAWLLIWSLIAGFSQDPTMLIVSRAMQGIGNGAYLPAGIALLAQAYRSGPRKNFVFSLYGAMAVIGFYFGILMSAVTAQMLDWRWYFWIGTVLILANSIIGFFTIPKNLTDRDSSVKMDWLGVATIVPGIVLVVFALTGGGHAPNGWKTPYVIVTFVIGVLLLCAAVYVEGWVATQPLLPAELFKPKYMKRLAVSLFCCYGVFAVFLFYASYQIETVLHAPPLLAAAWFTPLAVGGIILALVGGLIMHIVPNRILLLISSTGFLISVLLFALMPEQSASGSPSTTHLYWAYVFPSMVCGTIGVDITYNVTNVFITTSMPARLQATAGGLINSLLYLGMAFWLGIGELAVSTAVNQNKDLSLSKQYQIGFWLGVGLAAVSLLLTITIKLPKASAELTVDEKARLGTAQSDSSLSP